MTIETISIDDYDALIELWKTDPNIGLSKADEKGNIRRFLEENQGNSFKIRIEGRIIGAVLCGNDGRRGYLYHMFVHPDFRKKGYGKMLADACLARLSESRIQKCHIHIFTRNKQGQQFWEKIGFKRRDDMVTFTKETG